MSSNSFSRLASLTAARASRRARLHPRFTQTKSHLLVSSLQSKNDSALQSMNSMPHQIRAYSKNHPDSLQDTAVIPGLSSQYGSLADNPNNTSGGRHAAWQAADNSHVQRVTQKAMIYELLHQQTRTIESVVPWFLENMPET